MSAGESPVVHRRIRGSYRRRLLDLLSDGPLTVSEAGRLVGLRLPHVSAELKKMRAEGFVQSDSAPGQRGAKQHLTASGWQALSSDELSRLASLQNFPRPPAAIGQLLAKDGPQLLIAYIKQLDETMIPIPVDGNLASFPSDSTSTGNRGVIQDWLWAVAREAEVRWYDRETLQRVNPPKPESEQTMLTDWTTSTEVIGLVRARLLDPRQSLRLPIGTWFAEPNEGEWPPLPLPIGSSPDWSLGMVHSSVPPLTSKSPILAIIPDRLATTTLLNHSIRETFVIGEASLLGRSGDAVPLSALDHWISRAHPRLSESERRVRLAGLRESIKRGKRTRSGTSRVEESTWRRFIADWPGRDWSEGEPLHGMVIDVQGLTHAAWLSLVDWSVSRAEETPVVIQYPALDEPEPNIHKVLEDSRVRLLILNREVTPELAWPTIRSDPLRGPSWFNLKLAGDVELPCHLYSTQHTALPTPPADWSPPRNSGEVMAARAELVSVGGMMQPSEVTPESSMQSRLFTAVQLSEYGDSEWADKMESQDPLAAWIATPQAERWSRWRRIGATLGADWVGLMVPSDVDVEALAEVAASASPKWQDAARRYLGERIRSENDLSLRLWAMAESGGAHTPAASWLASVLLSEIAWIGDEIAGDLARRCPDLIVTYPPEAIVESLTGLSWLEGQKYISAEWSRKLGECSTSSEKFRGWQTLRKIVQDEVPVSQAQIIEVVSLPLDWWAPIAGDLFTRLVEKPEGRSFILTHDIAWCATLLREPEEEHEVPGMGRVPHSGCPASLNVTLERLLGQIDPDEEMVGLAPLIDLKNSLIAVSKGAAPTPGQSHSLVGWLAQPVEDWPQFSTSEIIEGCAHTALRLACRRSGFHEGLRGTTQRKL